MKAAAEGRAGAGEARNEGDGLTDADFEALRP